MCYDCFIRNEEQKLMSPIEQVVTSALKFLAVPWGLSVFGSIAVGSVVGFAVLVTLGGIALIAVKRRSDARVNWIKHRGFHLQPKWDVIILREQVLIESGDKQ